MTLWPLINLISSSIHIPLQLDFSVSQRTLYPSSHINFSASISNQKWRVLVKLRNMSFAKYFLNHVRGAQCKLPSQLVPLPSLISESRVSTGDDKAFTSTIPFAYEVG